VTVPLDERDDVAVSVAVALTVAITLLVLPSVNTPGFATPSTPVPTVARAMSLFSPTCYTIGRCFPIL